jgi:hypothetical protein
MVPTRLITAVSGLHRSICHCSPMGSLQPERAASQRRATVPSSPWSGVRPHLPRASITGSPGPRHQGEPPRSSSQPGQCRTSRWSSVTCSMAAAIVVRSVGAHDGMHRRGLTREGGTQETDHRWDQPHTQRDPARRVRSARQDERRDRRAGSLCSSGISQESGARSTSASVMSTTAVRTS